MSEHGAHQASRWGAWLVLGLGALLAAGLAARCIDGAPVDKDAAQGLQMAVNLAHHGFFSEEQQPPYLPSMYREPLPIVAEAAVVKLTDALQGPVDASYYFSGERAAVVKRLNVVWIALLWVTVVAATGRLAGSPLLGLLAALLAVRPFISRTSDFGVNTLNTELLAALLLVTASLALLHARSKRRHALYLLAGAMFGLVALTKASMLYAFLGLVLVLGVSGVLERTRARVRLESVGALLAGALIVVAPWIGRNVIVLGSAQISLRGGLALYTRSLMDQISGEEYRGTFYLWAERPLQPLIGRLTGFGPADTLRGGRLERLTDDLNTELDAADLAAERTARPDQAVTFYRRGRAERIRLQREYARKGAPYPDVAADRDMKREGIEVISRHVGGELALAIPLLWRSGHWYLIVLTLAIAFGARGRAALALFALPGLALLLFYALATPDLPRFSMVVVGVAAVAAAALLELLVRLSRGVRGTRESGSR